MNKNERLKELLLLWEEMREKGNFVALEELCNGTPEILPELQEKVLVLESMRGWLGVSEDLYGLEDDSFTSLNDTMVTEFDDRTVT